MEATVAGEVATAGAGEAMAGQVGATGGAVTEAVAEGVADTGAEGVEGATVDTVAGAGAAGARTRILSTSPTFPTTILPKHPQKCRPGAKSTILRSLETALVLTPFGLQTAPPLSARLHSDVRWFSFNERKSGSSISTARA